MEYCVAELTDMDQVKALLKRYHLTTISDEDKPDGFVTTQMSDEQMTDLIENEQGLFVAKQDGKVVAFVMAASWQYWSPWPLFAHMIDKLGDYEFAGQTLTTENSRISTARSVLMHHCAGRACWKDCLLLHWKNVAAV